MLDMPLHASPSAEGQISPTTAHLLLSWMNTVVREGTGKSLQHARWHVAGKSGTAQVRQKEYPKQPMVYRIWTRREAEIRCCRVGTECLSGGLPSGDSPVSAKSWIFWQNDRDSFTGKDHHSLCFLLIFRSF